MIKNIKESAPRKRRRNDILLIFGLLAIIGIFALVYLITQKQGAYATVLKDGEEIGVYSLEKDATIPIGDGEQIANVLVIKDGKAYMESATCPDQICVKHRAVSKVGETIVCLPSKTVVKIIGAGDSGVPDTVV